MDIYEVIDTLKSEAQKLSDDNNGIKVGFDIAVEKLENIVKDKGYDYNKKNERISQLHREIEKRNIKIDELERQLTVKDSIIKKQAIMLACM